MSRCIREKGESRNLLLIHGGIVRAAVRCGCVCRSRLRRVNAVVAVGGGRESFFRSALSALLILVLRLWSYRAQRNARPGVEWDESFPFRPAASRIVVWHACRVFFSSLMATDVLVRWEWERRRGLESRSRVSEGRRRGRDRSERATAERRLRHGVRK